MQVLVRPAIIGAALLTVFMVWFNDQVLPRANHRLARLQGDIARVKPTLALNEQVINEIQRGQLYLRAARIDPATNRMRDVVIYDLSDPTRRRTIVADSGMLAFNATGEDLVLTLHSGNMLEMTPQEPERLQRNFFTTDLLKVRGVAARLDRDDRGRQAFKSDRELTVCELMDRVQGAEYERTAAWHRLRSAEADGARSSDPPKVPGSMGSLYCAAVAWAGSIGEPKPPADVTRATAAESTAAVRTQAAQARRAGTPRRAPGKAAAPANAGQADQPAPGAIRPDSEVVDRASEVMLEGLRREFQQAQAAVDRYRVEVEKKFAIAFACIVFVLLGAPIALRFPRGGVGLTIGVSFAVFGIYYVGLLAGEALADRNIIDPAVAMWTTDVLLGVVGIVLTARLGSEGSTSRGSETMERLGRLRERFLPRRRAA
jgi:lipopolysaccharide export system permease protein